MLRVNASQISDVMSRIVSHGAHGALCVGEAEAFRNAAQEREDKWDSIHTRFVAAAIFGLTAVLAALIATGLPLEWLMFFAAIGVAANAVIQGRCALARKTSMNWETAVIRCEYDALAKTAWGTVYGSAVKR